MPSPAANPKRARANQADQLETALNELLAAVRKVDGLLLDALEPTELKEGCPSYLPPFEQLIADLSSWRDAVEERGILLADEAKRESKRSG
jgi:hypothetical protein